MVNLKALTHCVYDCIRNYNLFIPEENEYDDGDDDDDDGSQEPATAIRQQTYKTWLYIVFLIGK
jgi:hypothetical protein